MTGSTGTREIATRYPVTRGLVSGTTTQVGDQENLVAEEGSLVAYRKREGMTR